MITHKDTYESKFSTNQLFDLVKNIEDYPKFLPWCTAARIIKSDRDLITAELTITFAQFSYKYTSLVMLMPPLHENSPAKIQTEAVSGPFKVLSSTWNFNYDQDKGKTIIEFKISTELRPAILQKMLGSVMEKAAKKMTSAFQQRAEEIHGNSPAT